MVKAINTLKLSRRAFLTGVFSSAVASALPTPSRASRPPLVSWDLGRDYGTVTGRWARSGKAGELVAFTMHQQVPRVSVPDPDGDSLRAIVSNFRYKCRMTDDPPGYKFERIPTLFERLVKEPDPDEINIDQVRSDMRREILKMESPEWEAELQRREREFWKMVLEGRFKTYKDDDDG